MGNRANKYLDIVLPNMDRIEKWLKEGATNQEVSQKLGIHPTTFCRYLDQGREGQEPYKKLYEIFVRSRTTANEDVEAALFKSACGYQWVETVEEFVYDPEGRLVSRKVRNRTVDVQPSVAAQQFWLMNKDRGNWRSKNEVVIEQPENGIIMIPEVTDG